MATQTPALPVVRCDSVSTHLLRVATPGQADRVVPIDRDSVSIGGGPQCTLRVYHRGARPLHCLITRGPDGLRVRRWASDTTLNGRPFADSDLNDGDELTLGATTIRLESAAVQEELAPAEPEVVPQAEPVSSVLACEEDALEVEVEAEAEDDWSSDPWRVEPAPEAEAAEAPAHDAPSTAPSFVPPVPAKLLKPWLDRQPAGPADAEASEPSPAPAAGAAADDVWSLDLPASPVAASPPVEAPLPCATAQADDLSEDEAPAAEAVHAWTDEARESVPDADAGLRVAALRTRVRALVATLRRERAGFEARASELLEATTQRDAFRAELETLTSQVAQLRLERERLEANSADDRQRLDELSDELTTAADTIEALQHRFPVPEPSDAGPEPTPADASAPRQEAEANEPAPSEEDADTAAAAVAPLPASSDWWAPASLAAEDILTPHEDAPAAEPAAEAAPAPADSPWDGPAEPEAVAAEPDADALPSAEGQPLDAAEPVAEAEPVSEPRADLEPTTEAEPERVGSAVDADAPAPLADVEPPRLKADPFAPVDFAGGHEPESFISRYAHLFADDAAPAVAEQPAAPIAPMAVAAPPEPAAPPAAADESSIEDYMSQLLRRSRGDSEEPFAPAPAAAAAVAAPPAAPVTPFTSLDQMQRTAQPERPADMSLLRELANQSARQAIDVASLRQSKDQGTTNLAISGIVAAVGAAAAFFATELLSLQLLGGVTLMLAAGGWGVVSIRAMQQTQRLPAPKPSRDEAED
ncbi:hypothetical protein Pla175_10150 [Pirellulimonas nuda]|uniref:FHA domain protein n=1 Tax=Pirellulimonas nuda TaxID=2528009 RepID=A0A518D838_9BACT|nr:hypothetical protein [Pirellulimonas nuda]QDU87649.1 hypothetical protein Pla175_10150 [Pirellulimonas nuda]